MLKCKECDALFEEPKKLENGDEVCPECESKDFEEAERCEMCGQWFNLDELVDTEGMVNGGIGYCCDDCCEDGDIR